MIAVHVIESDEDFSHLESDWQQLIRETPDAPYFLTWEFTANRWKHFREDRQLWILTARLDNGKLVGIAPFAIGYGKVGPLRARRLEFICRVEIPFRFERYYLDGEDLDMIAHPAYRDAVAALFTLEIDQHRDRWDVIDLAWLSANSPFRERYGQPNGYAIERTASRARSVLPASWEAYNTSILDRGLSKQNRYKRRRLERDFPGAVQFRCVEDRGDVVAAVDQLEDLKIIQFATKGSAVDPDDPQARRHRRFARDFALDAFDQGWLRFYQLVVNDDIIAANFGIALHGVYYLLNKGFDPEWKKHSPGYLLQAYEIQCSINEGLREYDLGQGLILDKLAWTQAEQLDVRLIYGATLLGQTYVAEEAAWTMARTRGSELLRSVLPESSYKRVKQAFRERARASTSQ